MATTTTLSIHDVAHFLFGSVDQQITFLQQKGLLDTCGTCHASMTLGSKRDISDGSIFRCRNCKTTKSLRVGSFFSKSKLPLQKWLVLLYWWIRQYPVGDAAEEARVSRETAILMSTSGFGKFALPSCLQHQLCWEEQGEWFNRYSATNQK